MCFLLLFVVAGCGGSDGGSDALTSTTDATPSSAVSTTVEWPTDGWPVSTPEEQGMSSEVLADLVDEMVAIGHLDSVTVVRNGYVVLDTTIYPFPEDTGHHLHSVTKSVTGTLIGIAIDRGLLSGVDVPVVEVLANAAPADVDDLKASMTVEHLLTMSTGLECRDSWLHRWQGLAEMTASDDWAAHVLALPMEAEPGTRFEYCNGASHLLSAILSEVTGMSAAEFATEVLFEPLGITEFVWPETPNGVTIGPGELVLQPSDAAKIGYLYLRGGEWDGDQVVSASWVEAAGSPYFSGGRYGYQWWVAGDGGWVTARGVGGQVIYVVPLLDLVVVFTAGLPEQWERMVPDQLMQRYVLPAIKRGPLPPDPDGTARLAAAVVTAGDGPEPSPVTTPQIARTIDGVRYQFRSGELPLEWFMLEFGDESARLAIEGLAPDPDAWDVAIRGWQGLQDPLESDIGLTGRYVIDDFYGLPTAWRGQWTTSDTFIIEFQMLNGTAFRGTFEFRFEDDAAQVQIRVAEGPPLTLTADRAG